ncbi:MAG TPA: hypothetical protein VEG43_03800 [Dehalococcoidia bacterium]|nr:hypothetical protein [Dehalococcoidia bacterium]
MPSNLGDRETAAKAMPTTVAGILEPGTIDRIRQEFRRGSKQALPLQKQETMV